jgi:VanZ family protein
MALAPNARSGWLMRTLGDKVLHGFAFGIGCLLWAQALRTNPKLPRITTAWIGAIIALAVGVAVEGLQKYVPSRTADLRDIVADVAGVLPALAYLTLLEVWRRPKRQTHP